jgi:hypothetical protein
MAQNFRNAEGQNFRNLQNYARIHQIVGWILVPVALAALTGFRK